ncbi:MAG TPA: hypothetical protein VFQ88_15265 [Nevskiaceae bacterium]|nr:hypothetical protein [Nevskiaceae bacterium]
MEKRATLTFHAHTEQFMASGSCAGAGRTRAKRIDLLAQRYMDTMATLLEASGVKPDEIARLAGYAEAINARSGFDAALLPSMVHRATSRAKVADPVLSTLAYKLDHLNDASLLAVLDACERYTATQAASGPDPTSNDGPSPQHTTPSPAPRPQEHVPNETRGSELEVARRNTLTGAGAGPVFGTETSMGTAA